MVKKGGKVRKRIRNSEERNLKQVQIKSSD
jgi:hypothetical protein